VRLLVGTCQQGKGAIARRTRGGMSLTGHRNGNKCAAQTRTLSTHDDGVPFSPDKPLSFATGGSMSAPRCRCVLPLLRHFLFVLLLSRVALPFVLPCLHRPLSAPSTRVFLSSDGSTATNLQASPTPALAVDARGRSRLPWRKEGYSYWSWQGHQIHYVALGTDCSIGEGEKECSGRPNRGGHIVYHLAFLSCLWAVTMAARPDPFSLSRHKHPSPSISTCRCAHLGQKEKTAGRRTSLPSS